MIKESIIKRPRSARPGWWEIGKLTREIEQKESSLKKRFAEAVREDFQNEVDHSASFNIHQDIDTLSKFPRLMIHKHITRISELILRDLRSSAEKNASENITMIQLH